MLGYTYQTTKVLFGSKSSANAITRAALTTSYADNTVSFAVGGMSKMNLNISYIQGQGESSNSIQIRVRSGTEGTNLYQIPNEAVSGGTSTLTQREFTFASTNGGSGSTGTLPYDTQTANFTVGQVATGGTSTHSGTIDADSDLGTSGTLSLSGATGVFQNNETITDPLGGSALVNGALTYSADNFSLPLDLQDEYFEIAVKESGVATNAGAVFIEATISGGK